MDDYFFSARPGFPIGLPAYAVVAVVLALLTIWTYLGHPQASGRRLTIILGLRLAALAVTLITAVRPTVGVNENPKQPSVLPIGIDLSESMTVKDELGGQARVDAVRKALEKCQPLFDELKAEQNVSVVLYRFGPADFNEATSRYEPTSPADAKRSDYGAYLARVFERLQTERVRAHVLIGDGAENGEGFTPFTEAARWARRGVQLHTVVVGSDSSGDNKNDIAVTAIECNPSPAYIKNDVTVTARVNAFGFAGTRVTARVLLDDKPIKQEEFVLERERGNELRLEFKAPEKKGEVKVKVEVGQFDAAKNTVSALPGELSPLNNWSETYLTVNKEGVRVLVVDKLRHENYFLLDAIAADAKRFDVNSVILQNDNTIKDEQKKFLDLEEMAFDVVIIGNVNGAMLDRAAPRFLTNLAEQAKTKGTGVMVIGGEFAFQGIPAEVMPVRGGPIVDKLNARGEPLEFYPAVPTARGLEKMFRTAVPGVSPKPGEAEEPWDRLNNFRTGFRLNGFNRLNLTNDQRTLYTTFAWTGERVANPAAGGDPQGEPLLVGSQRGDGQKGRWLAFGAFDTYLWRTLGLPKSTDGIKLHERFWKQCVLWLAKQDEDEGQVFVRPQFRQMKITQEQTVRVGAKLPTGADDPTAPLTVKILPLAPSAQEPKPEDVAKAPALPVSADGDTPKLGRKVTFRAPAAGEYFVVATTPAKKADGSPELNPDGSPKLHRGTAKFITIPDVSDEMQQVNANPDFMQKLASATGGKALRLDDLPGLLRELKAEAPPDAGKKPKYYPDWHRNKSRGFLPLWLVVFVALLGAEWGLRRLWGMV
jgi:hypothetical protein